MQNDETVMLCRERQAAMHHSLPLGSYLLKPVQRVLKYHLLLQSLMKQFPSEAIGRSAIEEALGAMTGLAQHINEMKRRHEHAVRVQEIQSLLHDWQGADLTTFGELCAEGTFRICGAKALRHAFLFDNMLLIAKRSGDHLICKTHIEVSSGNLF
jgi:pleckstrin homology domain-containing family G member 1/2/3